ncbi:MAG: hypothetical protein MJ090_03615 [Clostridia bacterium]|nr:hypothetical protein [Clostridia bacterium]
MKKIASIILAVLVLLSISIPVMAKDFVLSPENPESYNVTVYGVKGAKDGTETTVLKGKTISVSADTANGTFTGWNIDGKYEIVKGNSKTETITIKPLSDIVIKANFKKQEEKPSTDKNYDITCYNVDGVKKGGHITVKAGETAEITFEKTDNAFREWWIVGDYDFVSGNMKSDKIVLKPTSDLIVGAVYVPLLDGEYDTDDNGKYDIKVVSGEGIDGGENSGKWENNNSHISWYDSKNRLTVKAKSSMGKFNSWSIYVITYNKQNKKVYSEAKENVHYKLVINDKKLEKELGKDFTLEQYIKKTGTSLETLLKQKQITIIPYGDLVICGNYNGKTTSPKTNDSSILLVAIISVFCLAGIAVTTKKVLSK